MYNGKKIEEKNSSELTKESKEYKYIIDFWTECEQMGIFAFSGIITPNNSDILIYEKDRFLKFCAINGIKSVILDIEYDEYDEDEETEINIDECKKVITEYCERTIDEHSSFFLPEHINKDFYAAFLDEVLGNMEKEIRDINSNSKQFEEKEDKLISITAYALHEGCRVYTFVYSADDEESENNESINIEAEKITKNNILNKYKRLIYEKLPMYRKEAKAESERITKEIKDSAYSQITNSVRNNGKLITMKTQRSRNEFADRLYVQLKEENEYDWLTKTAIRSIVEREYFHLTEE